MKNFKTLHKKLLNTLLSLPAQAWFVFFLFFPFAITILISLMDRSQVSISLAPSDWELDSYIRTFSEFIYLNVFIRSFILASLTALGCLIIAVPAAFLIARSSPRRKNIFLFFVLVPLFSSFIVRAYGWRWLLHPDSTLGQTMYALGNFLHILPSNLMTMIGLLSCYLPLMFLPVFVAFDRFNFQLQDAAIDLGATPTQSFFFVVIPNNITALVSGFSLVFIPTLAEFVIPEFLGGAQTMLIGGLIREQFLKARNWPFGAALSVLLVLFGLLVWFILNQIDEQKIRVRKAKT